MRLISLHLVQFEACLSGEGYKYLGILWSLSILVDTPRRICDPRLVDESCTI